MDTSGEDHGNHMTNPADSEKQDQGRTRKPKKPEIQLYRPGALRQQRATNSGGSLTQDLPKPAPTKPANTKPDGEEVTNFERNNPGKGKHGTGRGKQENYEESDGRERRRPKDHEARYQNKERESVPKEHETKHQNKERESVSPLDNFTVTVQNSNEGHFKDRIIHRSRPQASYESTNKNSTASKSMKHTDQNVERYEIKKPKNVSEGKTDTEKNAESPGTEESKVKHGPQVNAHNKCQGSNRERKGENLAGLYTENNAHLGISQHLPEKKNTRKDKRKQGKGGRDREHIDKSDHLRSKRNSLANERGRGYKGRNEYTETEKQEYAAHEHPTKKMEDSENLKLREKANEKKVDGKEHQIEGVSKSDNRAARYDAKDKFQEVRLKCNKTFPENSDSQSQRSVPRGNKKARFLENTQTNLTKPLDSQEHGLCNDSNRKEEEGQMTVSELAAKVDQLAVGKQGGKTGGSKRKGKKGQESPVDKGQYIHDGMTKGTWLEVQEEEKRNIITNHSEPPDKNREEIRRGEEGRDLKEPPEKNLRAKSYSGARERRRMGGSGKQASQYQGNKKDESNTQEELKMDVVNRGSQEITATNAWQRTTSETEDRGGGKSRAASGKMIESQSSQNQKNVFHGSRNKPGNQGIISLSNIETKQSSGWRAVENEVPEPSEVGEGEENWGHEAECDLTWCNQESPGNSNWEDEKQSWRTCRSKHHSENEDAHHRVESPGHRGGLIQLSMPVSRKEPSTLDSSSHVNPSAPVPQKLLFNPNNPSKPVAVVPSSRDLPASREPPFESGRGEPGSGAGTSLASFMQSGQTSEYALEGHSPKVDPSIVYSIQKGEMDINYYVSSNQLPVEFRRIMDIRHHLQGCYRQLLISDIRLCQERNVEASLWKTLYYVIIEKLREYISRDPSLKERSLATLLMLVEEGQRYLQEVLEALQREYGFTLEGPTDDDAPGIGHHAGLRGRPRLALVSAQKLLLSLGDLARYREQYNSTPNYTLARKWYQMALQAHPRNGRPFNQLAIIAVNQKRPLDIVYYYVRSLTASNPFMSARDSLVSMFDDVRKKYLSQQQSEDSPVEGVRTSVRNSMRGGSLGGAGRGGSGEGLRQELWIRPDSGVTDRRTLARSAGPEDEDDEDIEDLQKMSADQLMKRFLISYLHCHGMLFSRVGLDGFRECCTQMLREFRALLLSGSPTAASPTVPRLSTQHLLQIMAINMYAVANTEVKDTRVGSGYRSAAQDLALVVGQEMFGCVVRVVVSLLPTHLKHTPTPTQTHTQDESSASVSGDPQRLFSPTLAHFMPPLKAWCDWLLYHSAVWNPPTPAHEYARASGGDTWESVAELATILQGLGPPDVTLTETALPASGGGSPPDLMPLRLTEDTFLKGYEPLMPAHVTLFYAPHSAHLGRACDWVRVERIRTCVCQFLCGVEPPVLLLKKTEAGDVLVPVIDTSPPGSPTTSRLSLSTSDVEVESESESEGSEIEEDIEGEVEGDSPLASTVRLLTKRKRALERKHRQQRKLQTLLEGCVTLEMEVRPRYLVPDTNCFIEHLSVVQDLVAAGSYTVMVPLVVLNELDGLSRDAAVAKYGSVGHAVRVREGAAAALHYLRVTKPPSLKCVTSQGSVLSSTTFTAEIDVPDATNDDKILSCCVHFCSDSTQRRPIRAGVRRLYREVVLLTEDRNLRVKAHARDVPVRDLLDFARWAGVG